MSAYVYRIYCISTGEFLYVGVTTNPRDRLINHKSKAWWPLGDVQVGIEGPMDMLTALEIEREAIEEEGPSINKSPNARVLRSALDKSTSHYHKIEDVPGFRES